MNYSYFVNTLQNKTAVYNAIAKGNPHTELASLIKDFELSTLAALALEKRGNDTSAKYYLDKFVTATNDINKNSLAPTDKLDTQLFTTYFINKFNASSRNNVLSAISLNFESIAQFVDKFNQSVLLETVVCADGEITSLLSQYISSKLNLAGYNSLELNKRQVDISIIGKKFSSYDALALAFNDKVTSVKNSMTPVVTQEPTTHYRAPVGGGGVIPVIIKPLDTDKSDGNLVEKPTDNNTDKTSVFSDLDGVNWATSSINELVKKGVLAGKEYDKFFPQDNLTREEFVKMLVAGYGMLKPDAKCEFIDVPTEAWYYKYVASATESGIVTGKDNGVFGIGENITREDMVVMAYRIAKKDGVKLNDGTLDFSDANLISDYAKQMVGALKELNVINGIGNGEFSPKSFANRAQAAVIVSKLIGLR
jgi:hypothetical protein